MTTASIAFSSCCSAIGPVADPRLPTPNQSRLDHHRRRHGDPDERPGDQRRSASPCKCACQQPFGAENHEEDRIQPRERQCTEHRRDPAECRSEQDRDRQRHDAPWQQTAGRREHVHGRADRASRDGKPEPLQKETSFHRGLAAAAAFIPSSYRLDAADSSGGSAAACGVRERRFRTPRVCVCARRVGSWRIHAQIPKRSGDKPWQPPCSVGPTCV